MASILNKLEEMETLLRTDGKSEAADLLAAIAKQENSTDFTAQIAGLGVWGGEGSIVDVTLSHPANERRFNELIVDLAEALDQLGMGTPRTRWVGQTIEDWLIANPK